MLQRLFALVLLGSALTSTANDLNLPDLGGAGGGLISASQEYELGQQWQRSFRAQMQTTTDPFIQTYTENIIRKISTYSELSDKRLDILIVENPTLNAFAVPGGVIGVNTGLFHYAETEQQFASVMAHELAHLSQRHFARGLDEQKNKAIPNLIALLASILVIATAGGDAGIAAVTATQAISLDNQLRFSRRMEQEADRIGMATMVRAGMNPYAMPNMFERMLYASRFQRRPPEFLITHPLTESRVSDSMLRAQQYQKKHEQPSLEYLLVKTRAELTHEKNMAQAIKRYSEELNDSSLNNEVTRYGLTLAQLHAKRFNDANQNAQALLKQHPDNLFYIITQAEIEAGMKQFDGAIARLENEIRRYPNHHALNVKLAETYMKAGEYKKCEALLIAHSQRNQKDVYVWYLLAETYGLTGKIFDVHTARTEYFLLTGIYIKAENHVRHALKMIKPDDPRRPSLEEKLKKIHKLKRDAFI